MEIIFTRSYLQELYIFGYTLRKKWLFEPEIVQSYRHTIDKLRAANSLEELYAIRSLNFKKLRAEHMGISSLRMKNQYRIICTVSKKDQLNIISVTDGNNP